MSHIINLKKEKEFSNKASDIPSDTFKSNDITWFAPEYTYYQKEKSWFIIPAAIAIILLIIAILLKNYTFAILIPVAFFCFYLYGTRLPKENKFSISHRGVSIDDKMYSYKDLLSFWIFYDPKHFKILSIRSKNIFAPHIQVPIHDQNPNKIRDLLIKYLPEIEQDESIIDTLMKKIEY